MKLKVISVLLIVVLVLAAAAVMAQRGRQAGKPAGAPKAPPAMGAPAGDVGAVCQRLKAELNLSDDQIKQLEVIKTDCRNLTQAAREDLQAKMKEMAGLWSADQPNADAIKTLAAQIDAIRAHIRDIAIDHAIAALSVLTVDQKAKLKTFVGQNRGMCMGIACGLCSGAGQGCGLCGIGCGMGPGGGCGIGRGAGCGMGTPKGPGPGAGCSMGKGTGPGAGGGCCPYAK